VVETFHQPRLIPKYLTESNLPSWESSANVGTLLIAILNSVFTKNNRLILTRLGSVLNSGNGLKAV
jgi:hypothetical protein